jgi:L-fuculose-phosphate aldolase
METIEHFAKISLVTRMLGRENLLSRAEVDRLQGLRGMYGIASPAPVCTDETMVLGADGQVACQVVQAPNAPPGLRLVADTYGAAGSPKPAHLTDASEGGEIRLTYRELTALIEDAVKSLR